MKNLHSQARREMFVKVYSSVQTCLLYVPIRANMHAEATVAISMGQLAISIILFGISGNLYMKRTKMWDH